MLCHLDVAIFVDGPEPAWGHADGQLDLHLGPQPLGPESISIPLHIPEVTKLGFLDLVDLSSVVEWDGGLFIQVEGVAPNELAAAHAAWLLRHRHGFSITPYQQRISQAWLAARGGLHDARLVAVEHKGRDLALCFDDEWANEPEAERFGGPGDLIVVRPQVLVGDLVGRERGRISKIALLDGIRLMVEFFDGERIEFSFAEVRWHSYGEPLPR